MEIRDLIAHFAAYEKVPVDVQDHVVPVLKENSTFELYFWRCEEIDTGIYKGQMTQWEYPCGDKTITVFDVDFAASLTPDWERLVCCKELVHILDPIDHRVMTEDGFHRLIEKIVLPPGLSDGSDSIKVLSDRIAIWYALAILFPWATRQLFKKPLEEGKLTIEEIASIVDLPVEYAALVMHDVWEETHHIITSAGN